MEEFENLRGSIVVKRRSSLFRTGIGSQNSTPVSMRSSYEQQLNREIENWGKFMQAQFNKLKELKESSIVLDDSILSEEQRHYLDQGIDISKYLTESNKFRKVLEVYVQCKTDLIKQYDEVLAEARGQLNAEALDMVEDQLLSQQLE
ncbi:uncharacterized protein LOC129744743 [Uranotaenia lowii]|uniref:uncharacterized protein LOC129744743 n=1 Tax=Uranotaenia lowii TaxID=190385 RepID=UPI00247919D6|nr:uncharacterized protein LOC129744743 [Uranotaenia lowii]